MPELSIGEQSAHAAALGQYARFLLKRYQRLDLVEIGESDPVSLRQIFVPMRVGTEDLPEEGFAALAARQVKKAADALGQDASVPGEEPLPGEDVWDLLIQKPFVMLAGRPGSGKTTLVQAIVTELCNEDLSSRLRQGTRAIPMPLLLRHIPDLDSVETLDDLLIRWWSLQAEQAASDRLPLDLDPLRRELNPRLGLRPFTVLLLIDGIDEVGGQQLRQQLLDLSISAVTDGYRVLVTGRPDGFVDLQGPRYYGDGNVIRDPLYHVLPFAKNQIRSFMNRWYHLRSEWERRRKEGVETFMGHLERTPYLLSLARRPIFLTLMALVHTTQNQMPEGRPLLYRQIIDLYLERQERHRQRRTTVEGAPMPHWPATEVRLVLGHLAWRSQGRGGAELKLGWKEDADKMRRVVWERGEMEATIRRQFSERLGRFAELGPADATALVDYFLHPAGLLVEPEAGRIQFAHLSFQEYLCAWFLHERAKVAAEGVVAYLKKELHEHLDEPGWDEVDLLLLRIRADETGNEGHFAILDALDLGIPQEADLFVNAVTGRELPFREDERLRYLPATIAAALIYPRLDLALKIARIKEWRTAGLRLLRDMLAAQNDEAIWSVLVAAEVSFGHRPSLAQAQILWLHPPRDSSWEGGALPVLPRAKAMLQMVNSSRWLTPGNILHAIEDSTFDELLRGWLDRRLKLDPHLLWRRSDPTHGSLVHFSGVMRELDELLPDRGALWKYVLDQCPVDALLLVGEAPRYFLRLGGSPSFVLLALQPGELLPERARLAVMLYQCTVVLEAMSGGPRFEDWLRLRSRLRLDSASMIAAYHAQPPIRSRSRFRFVALKMMSISPERSGIDASSFEIAAAALDMLPSEDFEAFAIATQLAAYLQRFVGSSPSFADGQGRLVVPLLARLAFRLASIDWFREQARDPALCARRGSQPGEPLPRDLRIFDHDGMPFSSYARAGWAGLGAWLADDEAILSFVFPQGLSSDLHEHLAADLAQVRAQPEGLHRGIDALLADWPHEGKELPYTIDAAEKDLQTAYAESGLDRFGSTG